jgi:tRNA dimethylallyltransferase
MRTLESRSIIAVVGPTASGKTALAIALAEHLGTEIISADAMQFYRGMEIGTAAPTPAERARVPHHFVSFLDPGQLMAAGAYESLARERIAALHAQGKPVVVVGGSGLYLSALIDGLFHGPKRQPEIREHLKAEAREKGNAYLFARLQEADPDYAASLSSENDLVRIIRALEVCETTGQPFTRLHREHRDQAEPMDALFVALEWDRAQLYERINRRVDRMVEYGWVDEVRTLIDQGYGPHLERLKALGYREIAAHLRGEQSLEAAMEATKMHHRRYAKRQISWFCADARVHWIPAIPETPVSAFVERALALANEETPSSTPRLLPKART